MKKLSKILVLLLSVALVCAGLVIAVSANGTAETVTYTNSNGEEVTGTLSEAFENAESGTTITLMGDCTIASAFTVNKELLIDLNGYTLNSTSADTFIFNEAYSIYITGTGNINLAGRLASSTASAGVQYTLDVSGDGGTININHTGTAAPHIVQTLGGSHHFYMTDIVSTRAGGTCVDAFFTSGTYTGSSNKYTISGVSDGVVFSFDTMTFYCDETPLAQNALTFAMIGGGATCEINNSAIYSAGTILHCGYNTSSSIENILYNVTNSHLEIVSTDNDQRSCLVWVHESAGSDTDIYGTVYLENSYIGGNCYRAVHGSTGDISKFKILLDGSVIANTGANDSETQETNGKHDDNDKLLVRGVLIHATNNSAIVSGRAGGLMSSGAIWAEEGTRFNTPTLSGITWVDAEGNTLKNEDGTNATLSVVLDPVGNYNLPYVATSDTSIAYAPTGASNVMIYAMEHFRGYNSKSPYGMVVDETGSIGGSDFDMAFEGQSKQGAFTHVTYGNNTSFKYWVTPTDTAGMGETRIFASDPYLVLGGKNAIGSAIAKLSDTKVAVYEFDMATDSEYGFPKIQLQTQARTDGANDLNEEKTTDQPTSGPAFMTILPDGTIDSSVLKDYNSEIALSTDGWNHITFVVYLDSTNYAGSGQGYGGYTYVFINGECLGYTDSAYGFGLNNGDTAYVQGIRFNFVKGSANPQTVGSSVLFDNLMTRTYADYNVEGEEDGADKYPAQYILSDLPENTTPINGNITVMGNKYATINDAIAASGENALPIVLKGNVYNEQTVTQDVEIISNGYSISISDESYGCVVDGNVTTFSESYQYTAWWYKGELSNVANATEEDFDKVVIKLGMDVDHEYLYQGAPDFNNFTLNTQIGWNYEYGLSESITPMIADMATIELADENGVIKYYPVMDTISMAFYIKNAEGDVLSYSMESDEADTAFNALNDGETLILLQDTVFSSSMKFYNTSATETIDGAKYVNGVLIDNDYTAEDIAAMRQVAKNISIDLNGNSITIESNARIAVGKNIELNVYSSRAGSEIVSRTLNANNSVVAQRTFIILHENATDSMANGLDTYNARINVGTYTDKNGNVVNSERINIAGSVLFEGDTGDNSCSINVDGVIAARTVSDGRSVVLTRYYDGEIIIKNSVIANMVTNSSEGKSIVSLLDCEANYVYTPYVLFDNCILLNHGGTQNVVFTGGEGEQYEKRIEFIGCTSNGRLNPASAYHVFYGNGTAAHIIPGLDDGIYSQPDLVLAYYNTPMTLGGFVEEGTHFIKVRVPVYNAETGAINDENYYYYVECGYGEAFAAEYPDAAYLELPILTQKLVTADEAVKVTYSNFDGTEIETHDYVKGGNVSGLRKSGNNMNPINGTDFELNAIKIIFEGWGELPENIQESVVVYPKEYSAISSLKGIKANLSLYSDFNVNLYIPDSCEGIITVDGLNLVRGTGNKADYLVATLSQRCNNAADDVVFTLNISEEYEGQVFEFTETVSLSIAEYAETVLGGEYTAADKVLVYNMLNYANEAEKYFDGEENTVISNVLFNNIEYADMYQFSGEYDKAIEDTNLGGAFASATVDLKSSPAYVLTLRGGFVGTVTVKYAGGNNVRTYTFDADDSREIKLEGMKIHNFGQILEITAVGTLGDAEVNVSGTYSFDTFAKYHSENALDTESETQAESLECLNLINALSNYIEIAELYKSGELAGILAAA